MANPRLETHCVVNQSSEFPRWQNQKLISFQVLCRDGEITPIRLPTSFWTLQASATPSIETLSTSKKWSRVWKNWATCTLFWSSWTLRNLVVVSNYKTPSSCSVTCLGLSFSKTRCWSSLSLVMMIEVKKVDNKASKWMKTPYSKSFPNTSAKSFSSALAKTSSVLSTTRSMKRIVVLLNTKNKCLQKLWTISKPLLKASSRSTARTSKLLRRKRTGLLGSYVKLKTREKSN